MDLAITASGKARVRQRAAGYQGKSSPLFDGGVLARRPGRGARSPRLRDEVLHGRWELGPRREQHADLLHPRRHQVPGLYSLAEAGSVHEPAGARQRVGLLLAGCSSAARRAMAATSQGRNRSIWPGRSVRSMRWRCSPSQRSFSQNPRARPSSPHNRDVRPLAAPRKALPRPGLL